MKRLLVVAPFLAAVTSRVAEAFDHLVNVVHGALRHCDLADLVKLAGPARVEISQPIDPMGQDIR